MTEPSDPAKLTVVGSPAHEPNSRNRFRFAVTVAGAGALLLFNLIWFLPNELIVLSGDDLLLWHSAKTHPSLLSFLSADLAGKFRPVFSATLYWLFQLFGTNGLCWFLFNVLCQGLASLLMFRLARTTGLGSLPAALVSLLFASASSFAYFAIYSAQGVLEGLGLILCVLLVDACYRQTRKSSPEGFGSIVALFTVLVFTHERFVFFLPALVAWVLTARDWAWRRRMVGALVFCGPVVGLVVATRLFGQAFLRGTQGGVPLTFAFDTIARFLGSGALAMLGIQLGPTYLVGGTATDWDVSTRLMAIAGAGCSIVLLASHGFARNRLSNHRQIVIGLALACAALLGSASITFRQEPRWLYAPYVVFLTWIGHAVATHGRPRLARGLLVLAVGAGLFVNAFARRNIGNTYLIRAHRWAASIIDATFGEHGRRMSNYTIFIEGPSPDTPWITKGSMIFAPYAGEQLPGVTVMEDSSTIDVSNIDWNTTLFLKLDDVGSRFIDATASKRADFDVRRLTAPVSGLDFLARFATGRINSAAEVSTPTGRGVLLGEWAPGGQRIGALTAISGFSYTYEGVRAGKQPALHFWIWLVYPQSDGARAYVEVAGVSARERVFQADLSPESNRQGWVPVVVPLDRFADQTIDLVFGAESPSGNPQADWVAFGTPVLATAGR